MPDAACVRLVGTAISGAELLVMSFSWDAPPTFDRLSSELEKHAKRAGGSLKMVTDDGFVLRSSADISSFCSHTKLGLRKSGVLQKVWRPLRNQTVVFSGPFAKSRFFGLGDGHLSYWRSADECASHGVAEDIVHLDAVDTVEVDGRILSLVCRKPQHPGKFELCLQASTVDDANSWYDGIKAEVRRLAQEKWHCKMASMAEAKEDDEYCVCIHKPDGTSLWGLEVVKKMKDLVVLVKEVKRGLVEDWNIANPTCIVESGHRIVEVNGIRGDPQAMLNKMKSDHVINMKIKSTQVLASSPSSLSMAPAWMIST